MFKIKNITRLLILFVAAVYLSGCAGISTAISKRHLVVQAKTSTAIFVDAVEREHRTIYVDIRSGVMEFDKRSFKKFVKNQLAQSDTGYRVVDSPKKAQFQLNIFVLSLEKTSETAADRALKKGYIGGGGMLAGAAIGASHSNSGKGVVGGAVIGALAETIGNAFFADVTYMLVADVQIKEKARKGVIIRKDTKISTKVSDSGGSTQRYSEAKTRKEYRARIVTTANQSNLELADAQELMFKKTAYAMAGFF